jgi:hypothetical protein
MAAPATADPLYNQPVIFPVSGQIAVWDSINSTIAVPPITGFAAPPNNFATAYDNFSLPSTSAITTVGWTGGFHAPATAVPIDSFTLTFYNSAGTQPGSGIASFTIPSANVTQSTLGMEPGTGSGVLAVNYSADLPTPFLANPNTDYWLSIVANYPFGGPTNPNFVEWGWHIGTAPDQSGGLQNFNFPGSPVSTGTGLATTPTGLAFTFSGQPNIPPIPEPASVALWGTVALAGLAYRWRRPKAKAV